MNIELFLDLACPWCFIGKRRLTRALSSASTDARLQFRAFQLQPGLPVEGVPAEPFFERKFGSKDRVRQLFERITSLGRAEGITFDFAAQRRAPNTELCHRVVHLASTWCQGEATVDALFRGYFEQGVDLTSLFEIVALLAREGVELDAGELCDRLASGEGKAEVTRDLRTASDYGVGSVPLFIFDRRYAIEGAQPIEQFGRLITKLHVEGGLRPRLEPGLNREVQAKSPGP